jgi:hypothetical protein
MAQTVALDFHAVAVDKMLESFMQMNMKVRCGCLRFVVLFCAALCCLSLLLLYAASLFVALNRAERSSAA